MLGATAQRHFRLKSRPKAFTFAIVIQLGGNVGWRAYTIGAAAASSVIWVPQVDWMREAYHSGDEVFLAGLIFGPALVGLSVLLAILPFDFIRDPDAQKRALGEAAKSPRRFVLTMAENAASAVFVVCMALSFVGVEWIIGTWWFWSAFLGCAVVMFVPKGL